MTYVVSFVAAALLGGLGGVLVSMVSHSLPLRMKHEWDVDAAAHLGLPHVSQPCPPLLPLRLDRQSGPVEALRMGLISICCALATALIAYQFGPSVDGVVYSFFVLALITAAVIDLETQLLPDLIIQPLVWAGLLYTAWAAPQALGGHLIGAVLGYLMVRFLPGIGQGDAKLCACAGGWLGAAVLPWFFLIGATSAVLVGVIQRIVGGEDRAYAFGPHLTCAIALCLVWPLPKLI